MNAVLRKLFVLMAVGLVGGGAEAATVFTQSPGSTNGSISDVDNSGYAADDFVLGSAATVVGVRWWGMYAFNDSVTEADDFTIRFYADDGSLDGHPGTVLATRVVGAGATRTDTGAMTAGFDRYVFEANIAGVALSAGTTYHISIVNDTAADTNDDWIWNHHVDGDADLGSFSSTSPTTGPWNPNGMDLAFELVDVAFIPEPSRALLAVLGFCGVAMRRRR